MSDRCQITMGEYRGNVRGNYYECGKPAKFMIHDRLRGNIKLCGIHARALRKRGRNLMPLSAKSA